METTTVKRRGEICREMESTCIKCHTHISVLFPEILTMIFGYLNTRGKGRAARVCVQWRNVAYNKMVWRGVEAKLHLRRANPTLFTSLVKRGIKRIQVLSLQRSLRDLIMGVPCLESLNMSGCFSITDTGIGHVFVKELPHLTTLDLSLCKPITDSSLGRIARYLKNLHTLELGGCCNITSHGVSLLACGLKKLRTLNLRSCRHIHDKATGHLAGYIQRDVPGTPGLQHLNLQDCQVTDVSLRYMDYGLPSLVSINLSFCPNITDTGLRYLSRLADLREVNLRSCDNISDVGIGFLAEGGSAITALDVSFCRRVGDRALTHVSEGMFHLRCLSLCASDISDAGVERMVRSLGELRTLNIGQCSKVTDRSLTLIAEHLTHLSAIDLYGCTRITCVGLEKITKIEHLTTLNLGLWRKH